MPKLAFAAAFALILASCASRSSAPAADSAVTPASPERAAEPQGSSEILRDGKKCPKRATLVEGKCRLDVESDE